MLVKKYVNIFEKAIQKKKIVIILYYLLKRFTVKINIVNNRIKTFKEYSCSNIYTLYIAT